LPDDLLGLQLLLAHRKRLQDKKLAFQVQEKHLSHCLSNETAKVIQKSIKQQKRYFVKQLSKCQDLIDRFLDRNPSLKLDFSQMKI
jgi:hypothetical protein